MRSGVAGSLADLIPFSICFSIQLLLTEAHDAVIIAVAAGRSSYKFAVVPSTDAKSWTGRLGVQPGGPAGRIHLVSQSIIHHT